MPYFEQTNTCPCDIESWNRAVDKEFDLFVCSDFDEKKYHFLCIEVSSEPDAHDDWIGIK